MIRVVASGVFDLFHIGHLRFLEYEKSKGDYLIASTLADELVLKTKGRLPVVSLEQRVEILAGLCCVDEVYVQPTSTRDVEPAIQWITGLKVDRGI